MSQVIGVIIADQGIERFLSRWVVVLDDGLLSITVLGGYFVVTKSGVNISPHSDSIVYFFRKVVFGCVFIVCSTEYL